MPSLTAVALLLIASAAYLVRQFWTQELDDGDALSADLEDVDIDERKAA